MSFTDPTSVLFVTIILKLVKNVKFSCAKVVILKLNHAI